ncbi:hypothetical protein RhoFasB10_03246 [Rhodococcus sp. B10]|nr:phage tail tape measure protein [Rhodococcus sp. B10]NIL77108.1 hypothetical protein [Rhodococcus sp. B10]
MKSAVKVAGAAAAVAAVAIGTQAVQAAGEYESSLSRLKQASGATTEQMSAMSKMAQELGRDNDLAGVSASHAAATMTELSKAGLSVEDTLAAAKGTMSLAKAGNVEFSEAAIIAASALNAFNMEGKEATKVADTLAAGANASQADLADLALGLQQSATVAKQFKLGLNDNVTALALFANNGIKGSDAGTSLKTMLIALAKPSEAAAGAMEEIGFNAYDANGQFVGLREMSKRLSKSLSGLTDEQKQNALATIFGTDAFRAASILADNAGDSYDGMSKKVGESGAAQKAAAAQMGPYEKSVERAKNAVDSFMQAAGKQLLPAFTMGTNAAADFIEEIADGVPQAVETIKSLIPPIMSVVTTFAPLVAAFIGYRGAVMAAALITTFYNTVMTGAVARYFAFTAAITGARGAITAATVAQGALNATLMLNPIGIVVGLLAALTAAVTLSMFATDREKNSTDLMNQARERQKQLAEEAKQKENELRDAQLGVENANIRVERAQKTYNDAVAQYGPKSLEAREAALQLKGANAELEDSTRKVTNQINDQLVSLQDLNVNLDNLNGKSVTYNVRGNQVGAWEQDGKKFFGGQFATGTTYAPGGMTLVGEHGPELMRVPQGAQIFPNYQSRNMMAQGGGDTIITISGNISIATPEAAESFWNRIDKTQRLARVGMA